MKILAIDSSGVTASVAVIEDDILKAEYTVDYKKTHSQTLLPMIAEIARMTDTDIKELDAIAVAAGPGSFTGLRIGAATAKGIAFVADIPIIPVPTVDALAYCLVGNEGIICPLMNARRKEAYTGIYRFEGDRMITLKEQCVLPLSEILPSVNEYGERVMFLGDGIPEFMSTIKERVKVPYYFAPPHLARQRAGAVGTLGQKLFEEGKAVSVGEFKPVYLRLSQAERERLEKENGESMTDFRGKHL